MTDNDVRRLEDKVDEVKVTLARLEGSLSPTLQKITEDQEDFEKRQQTRDREIDRKFEKTDERLSALERFRYSVPSLAALAFLADIAIGVFLVLHQ